MQAQLMSASADVDTTIICFLSRYIVTSINDTHSTLVLMRIARAHAASFWTGIVWPCELEHMYSCTQDAQHESGHLDLSACWSMRNICTIVYRWQSGHWPHWQEIM